MLRLSEFFFFFFWRAVVQMEQRKRVFISKFFTSLFELTMFSGVLSIFDEKLLNFSNSSDQIFCGFNARHDLFK